MEFTIFLVIFAVLALGCLVIGLLFVLNKKQTAGLLSQSEQAASTALASVSGTLTHGQKIGNAIDAIDSLGAQLGKDGFVDAAEWQPISDQLTAAVAQKKHVAPPVIVAPPVEGAA